MARVRVPLYGAGQQRVATVDTEATKGAIVGVNLRNRDGTLWQPPAAAGTAPSQNVSLADVMALAASPIQVAGSVAGGAFTYSWNGTTDDVPEGSRQYFTADRAYAALKGALVAGDNITLTPNDAAGKLTITGSGGSGTAPAVSGHYDGGNAVSIYTLAQHTFNGGTANG